MDVSMGGRIAEEIGAFLHCLVLSLTLTPIIVYGPDSVTSGCVSDLYQATNVATAMVHETIANGDGLLSPAKRKKTVYVPEGETGEERDARTIFVGNVPAEAIKSKVMLPVTIVHMQ